MISQQSQTYQTLMVIAFLVLIVLAAGQECPYCEYNACQITSQGLGNCSACNVGALVQFTTGSSYGSPFTETIGVCMLCGDNCLTCEYGPYSNYDTLTTQFYVLCTECAYGYTVGGPGQCLACPVNCLACSIIPMTISSTYCTQCADGYTGGPENNYICTLNSNATTTALQDGSGSAPGMSGLTIGLICWGAIMTVLSVVFIVLWMRKQEKGASNAGLLGSEIEVTASRT